MADFRPSPWLVEDFRGRGNNMLRIVDAHGRGLARINASIDAKANAQLIAAAPKMFAVLSLVRAAYLLSKCGQPETLADETSIMAAIENTLSEAGEQLEGTEA